MRLFAEHFEAGADHMVIEPISVEDPSLLDVEAFEPIAAAALHISQ
ncbi:MAG: hypothetical protein KTV68_06695 [Acidimicrobiia bacterium]|nr:hypothetical protein [Acidimicrobiia bacterium]